MNRFLYRLVVLLVGVFCMMSSYSQSSIPEPISVAFKAGNAKELSKFFNSSLEIVVLENENIYSKSQAEQIINGFFQKNKITNFKILHEGGKASARYAIGVLETDLTSYRVYFLIKSSTERPLIHQLRIEKENGN